MVLNGRKEGVSKESYHQIWNHARRSGYRPKGMITEPVPEIEKTGSVGFLLRSDAKLYSQNPFFAHVQQGLHDYLAQYGITQIFLGNENHIDVDKLKELYLNRQSLRGLVVLGEVARPFLIALKKLEPRIVSVAVQYPGLCHSVVANDEQGADLIVQHLMDLGHRSFAWLGGYRGMQRSRARFNALTSAFRLRDTAIDPKFCVEMEGAECLQGRMAAAAILNGAPREEIPTAWICFSGPMARGAANYLLQEGIKIPGDISLISFDNTRVCEEDYPTLTGAGTIPEKMGRVAGELLLQNESETGERFTDIVLASELLVRESTGKALRKKSNPASSHSAG